MTFVEGVKVLRYTDSPEVVYSKYLHEQWSDIYEHLPRLMEAAKGNILEIGVRSGVSTAAFLAGVKTHGGHVYSIDIEPCNVFPDDPDWTFRQLDSNDIGRAEALRQLGQDCFDVVFIDGDHSFNACLSDLQRFGVLAPRIFLHDYDMKTVRGAIALFLDEHPEYDITTYNGSFGLAELNRRE